MAMPAPETATPPLTLTLFGPMQVQVQGQALPRLHSRKSQWLLALLALRHARPVEREWLAGTLWPDADQDQAFASLRPVLSDLRRALGSEGERLQSPSRHTLFLDLAAAAVDVLNFDAQIASKTLPALARAVALYTGPLLEGCAEEWAGQERTVREQDCLRALGILANAALTAGDHSVAAEYFRRAVALDPWQDAARRGLMQALAQGGDRNAALQVYREFTVLLRSDPKAVPDEETSALYGRLRREVRRKTAAPMVASAHTTGAPVVTGYLPHPLTALVGREDERLEVAAKLRRSRLVTLTGPGGIGKTRLAIEVAAEAAPEFAEGVWLVALEALSNDAQVAGQVAAVLGLKQEASRATLQILIDHLRQKRLLIVLDNCEHLLEASVQLAGYLLRECAGVRILATSREPLGITGETAWGVPALTAPDPAHLLAGQGLPLKVLAGYESVQLFVERAQGVQKTFSLTGENALNVAQICFRLEGLPLAIELAAARVKAMTVAQIASRLDDRLGLLTGGSRTALSRQQTLRGTLDWSYELLGDSERVLLRRLSVFVGGWTLSAVEYVCADDGLTTGQVVDLLTSLVDKSLVAFDARETEARETEAQEFEGRYRLLETVRQYAAERLVAAGETANVRARHRDYFLALAEEAEARLNGAEQGVWLARMEAEHANLRAALDWCRVEQGGVEAGLRLAGALGRFWEMHGYYSEGRASLAEALQREGSGGRSRRRAKALNVAGVLAFYQGDYREARMQHEEGLAISRELGDRASIAWALNDLGDVAGAQGSHDAAQTLYAESLTIFRELGNRQGVAQLVHHLGRVLRDQGDYAGAKMLYEEGLATQRELGDRQGVAWALHHLGNLAGLQGDSALAWSLQENSLAIFRELGNRQGVAWALQELGNVAIDQADSGAARTLYAEGLMIFRELGNRQGVAQLVHHLGRILCEQGDYAGAKILYEEGLAIQRELGNRQGAAWILNDLGKVAVDLGHFAPAQVQYAEGLSLSMDLEDRRGAAMSLRGLAASLLARGNARKAAQIWGAVEALYETAPQPLSASEIEMYSRQVAQARTALGESVFAATWEAGHALTWEQVAAYALGTETTERVRFELTEV